LAAGAGFVGAIALGYYDKERSCARASGSRLVPEVLAISSLDRTAARWKTVFGRPLPAGADKAARWARPELVCEVALRDIPLILPLGNVLGRAESDGPALGNSIGAGWRDQSQARRRRSSSDRTPPPRYGGGADQDTRRIARIFERLVAASEDLVGDPVDADGPGEIAAGPPQQATVGKPPHPGL